MAKTFDISALLAGIEISQADMDELLKPLEMTEAETQALLRATEISPADMDTLLKPLEMTEAEMQALLRNI